MIIDFEDLFSARPEHVARLARSLGIQVEGLKHSLICQAIVRWYKRNPQPRPENR